MRRTERKSIDDCSVCGSITEMVPYKVRGITRYRNKCRHCLNQRAREKYDSPITKQTPVAVCNACGQTKNMRQITAKTGVKYYSHTCVDCYNSSCNEYSRKARITVLSHYSPDGIRCQCCGEDRVQFMAL